MRNYRLERIGSVGAGLAVLLTLAACAEQDDKNPFVNAETGSDMGMTTMTTLTGTTADGTATAGDTTGGQEAFCGDGKVDDGEDCDDGNDDDADGCTVECTVTGGFLWEVDVGNDTAKAIAVGGNGRVAVGFDQTLLGEKHSYVATFDKDGTQAWVVEVGTAYPNSEVGDVAVSGLGEVVIAGHGEVGGVITGFIEVLDSSGLPITGGPISTGNTGEYLSGVEISPQAEIYVSGTYRGASAGDPFKGFVAKFDASPSGFTIAWRWNGPDDSRMTDLVRSDTGRVFTSGGTRLMDGWNAQMFEFSPSGTPAWTIEGHPSAPDDDNAFNLGHVPGDGVYVGVDGAEGNGRKGYFVRANEDGSGVGTFDINPGTKGYYIPLAVDATPSGVLAVTGYLKRTGGATSGWTGGMKTDGTPLWTAEIRNATVFSRGDDIAVGPDGTIYVAATVEEAKRVKLLAYAP